jgi:hypothetical protein
MRIDDVASNINQALLYGSGSGDDRCRAQGRAVQLDPRFTALNFSA